ncbi:methylmalonyl-CoA mutase family protein [Halalkalibacter krulwichiae]|nr:methylmalonyl-CoA mutase family protein [Halalkalibacter krulwichiae]
MNNKLENTLSHDFPIPTYQQWRETTEKALKGKPFETLLTKLLDDIVIEPMYQQKDLENCSTLRMEPGVYPFIRGNEVLPKAWNISQELEAPTPKLLNELIKHDLKRGQNVLHIVLEKNMKNGNIPSVKENGYGVPIYDLNDVKTTIKDIDLTSYPWHIDAGMVNIPLLAALSEVTDRLEGTIAADPIHQLIQEGKGCYSFKASFDYMKIAVEWAKEKHNGLRTVLVQTHAYHNGGISPCQELAIALATGVTYVNELMDRGVSATDAGKSITFSFSIGNEFFTELAKIRAARLLWAAIMREFGASEQGQKMSVHARTSSLTKTKQDPYVNLLRGTSEAFAAAVAGVDSIHVSPLDEALHRPSAFSRRIARNTSLILQEEAYIHVTKDPAGGSWYVEALTEKVAQTAWAIFQEIEKAGGMIPALRKGLIQDWVENSWEQRKVEIEQRKKTIVGVNRYVSENIAMPPNADTYRAEVKEYASKVIEDVNDIGRLKRISMEHIRALLMNKTPIHVIHNLLQEGCNGEQLSPIETKRLAEAFEHLKKQAKVLKEKRDGQLIVQLIGVGVFANHKTRVDFSSEFFRSGGFDVRYSSVTNESEIVEAAGDSQIIVLCGDDQSYHEHAIRLVSALKNDPTKIILLAGRQNEVFEKQLLSVGVDQFIHMKTNAYRVLKELLTKIGGE